MELGGRAGAEIKEGRRGEGKSVFQTEQYVKEQICNKCLLKN